MFGFRHPIVGPGNIKFMHKIPPYLTLNEQARNIAASKEPIK